MSIFYEIAKIVFCVWRGVTYKNHNGTDYVPFVKVNILLADPYMHYDGHMCPSHA